MSFKEVGRLTELGKDVQYLANPNSEIPFDAGEEQGGCRPLSVVFKLNVFSLLFNVNKNLGKDTKIFVQT